MTKIENCYAKMKHNSLTWLLHLSVLLIDFTNADFAELDFACEVVHL